MTPVYSCYLGALDFIEDLRAGVCENEQLLNDYQKYDKTNQEGQPNFKLQFEVCSWEYTKKSLFEEAIANYNKKWPESFYSLFRFCFSSKLEKQKRKKSDRLYFFETKN